MNVTLLYYTANRIPEVFAKNIRDDLVRSSKGKPIISVSQKPIDFGDNICVGDIGFSMPNVYKQILEGARKVKTQFVACCEDDMLYVEEHFDYKPADDVFAYNTNQWFANDGFYFHRTRTRMGTCLAATKLMVDILEKRFKEYPEAVLGEPGKYTRGVEFVNQIIFQTDKPLLVFNHQWGLGGRRSSRGARDSWKEDLEPWGNGKEVWRKYFGQG